MTNLKQQVAITEENPVLCCKQTSVDCLFAKINGLLGLRQPCLIGYLEIPSQWPHIRVSKPPKTTSDLL